MASAKFLEEALSTDVDESAVSAIVGSLETQLTTTTITPSGGVVGGGTTAPNGTSAPHHQKVTSNGVVTLTESISSPSTVMVEKTPAPPGAAASAVTVNGLPPGGATLVIKTTGAAVNATSTVAAGGGGGLVVNNIASAPPPPSFPPTVVTAAPTATLQVVNVRPPLAPTATGPAAVPTTVVMSPNTGAVTPKTAGQPPQPATTARLVLTAPQLMAGSRPGAPQLTLQPFHGLQPGQQGHLLLKTENGQYQLIRVGPAPTPGIATAPGTQNVTFRMQTLPATAAVVTSPAVTGVTTTVSTTDSAPVQNVQRAANDNTKEKCRKFLANLLELSSKEPVSVERSVRTLIQELIDMKVEPEDFCDKLERLLNASPQPCLIGFLKKSLPLLRHSLVTKEMAIDGIRPPPANLVFSIGGSTAASIQPGQVRPTLGAPITATNQVRIMAPGTAVVRPVGGVGGVLPQRLVTPVRATKMPPPPVLPSGTQPLQTVPTTPRMITTTLRTPTMVTAVPGANVIVTNTQPPALHPVMANTQIRPATTVIRPSVPVKPVTPCSVGPQAQTKAAAYSVAIPNCSTSSLSTAPTTVTITSSGTTTSTSSSSSTKGGSSTSATGAKDSSTATAPTTPTSSSTTSSKSGASSSTKHQTSSTKPSVPSSGSSSTSKPGGGSGSSGGGAGAKGGAADKEKKSLSGAAYSAGDDDINDVAAMGGVNLAEETQKILGSTEFVGTQIRSCKEEIMCTLSPLQLKIRKICAAHGLDEPGSGDVAACVSHAAQERVKNLLEKLAVIAGHRLDVIKNEQRYEATNNIRGQLKFLEDLDRAERKRHEENEREMLLRAAKSRSKTEDPEQAKLKAKAKEMQRVEMEELRQREANATALQAIGPRKKPKLDPDATTTTGSPQINLSGLNNTRPQVPLRQRIKKVTLKDLQFLFENEKDLSKSVLLYKSYLK